MEEGPAGSVSSTLLRPIFLLGNPPRKSSLCKNSDKDLHLYLQTGSLKGSGSYVMCHAFSDFVLFCIATLGVTIRNCLPSIRGYFSADVIQ
jgi:hypothetical protein